jgi:hypothetical protein
VGPSHLIDAFFAVFPGGDEERELSAEELARVLNVELDKPTVSFITFKAPDSLVRNLLFMEILGEPLRHWLFQAAKGPNPQYTNGSLSR